MDHLLDEIDIGLLDLIQYARGHGLSYGQIHVLLAERVRDCVAIAEDCAAGGAAHTERAAECCVPDGTGHPTRRILS